MAQDWYEVAQILATASVDATARGYDWVVWNEEDGQIYADYVHPKGAAARAGLQTGDVFLVLDSQTYFGVEVLQRTIEGMAPGTVSTFFVMRDGEITNTEVQLSRYPTFLYPLSATLWQFALWGFTLGAFLHMIGLAIVGPLAKRSSEGRSSLIMIFVSLLWMFGNALRMILIELFGPPVYQSSYDQFFTFLTLLSLIGWVFFPALLLRKVICDAQMEKQIGRIHLILFLPSIALSLLAFGTVIFGNWGPFTLDRLVGPILFYACCYVAFAGLFVLFFFMVRRSEAQTHLSGWSTPGSALTALVALVAGLSVLDLVPLLDAIADTTAGWLIVGAQLIYVAPVALVTVATLKLGNVDEVLSRALVYLTALGLFFFAYVGGLTILDPLLNTTGTSSYAVSGIYVVLLILLFERLGRRLQSYVASFFLTERQRGRRALTRFLARMRTLVSLDDLVQSTIQQVGSALHARSAMLLLRSPSTESEWLTSRYHPEPPYVGESLATAIWPYLQEEGTTWARNPELNESAIPADLSQQLLDVGVAVALPIQGDEAPLGILMLGRKEKRGDVYNLGDLELLRNVAGQLALAIARLNLIEREKELIKETAEAQLVALRAQINPHFLFNALNTIIALIEERPEEAEATVESLSSIFRHILNTSSRTFVSLEDELTLVSHYLTIEQARFGKKLRIERDIDRATVHHPVPAFVIQTLVENAVKHGIEKKRKGGTLTLTASLEPDGAVCFTVRDTGVGIPALFDGSTAISQTYDPTFFGIGLRNVSARMQQLYRTEGLLRISSDPEHGTQAQLILPPLIPDEAETRTPIAASHGAEV